MDFGVIQRIELPSIVIVPQYGGVIRRLGVHSDDGRRSRAASGGDQEKGAVEGACAAVRHLHVLGEVKLRIGQNVSTPPTLK